MAAKPSSCAFAFGTKAETLTRLRPLVVKSKILPQYDFTITSWNKDPASILQQIQSHFPDQAVAVRSSARHEDQMEKSNAGKYTTLLNIKCQDRQALHKAIAHVVQSYDITHPENQVLIQPMLRDVAVSGVVFTRDIETLAPYYIFNYDDWGEGTDTVTSGRGVDLKTLIHSRFSPVEAHEPNLRKLHDALRELENLCGCDWLDVEFAITKNGEIYIFQVRRLPGGRAEDTGRDMEIQKRLNQIHAKITEIGGPHPYLYGTHSVFGVMPDWNPAEIIGIKPRRLALTLYKELITDNIWAYQRNNYGYRNLRSFPLMVTFTGMPYIDVRVDFNSFIPADLDEGIANRLAIYYIDKLIKTPDSHDKVEFDIVFSCYTLDLPERLEGLRSHGFNSRDLDEIQNSLRRLTNRIIDPLSGLYTADDAKIGRLQKFQTKIMNSNLSTALKIYWLLEDCKRYGTLPFAGLARAAFIAVQFLQSFRSLGIVTPEEFDHYLKTMNTVAKQLSRDLSKLSSEAMGRQEFLERYGHLRPGTYDILSKRYDEGFEQYFPSGSQIFHEEIEETVGFSADQKKEISRLLKVHGITVEAEGLLKFIRATIEGREYAKFVFSKSVSDALRWISRLGRELGFSDDDLSYLDITTLQKTYASMPSPDLRAVLEKDIADGREHYQQTKQLRLPPLICDPLQIYSFYLEDGTPNYVTLANVTAEIVKGEVLIDKECARKIVMIENADPGYDWVFARGIAGLITMYGGANSHMAIRAAEMGIPAVIGCGEKWYRLWNRARMLEIDAANKLVRIIR